MKRLDFNDDVTDFLYVLDKDKKPVPATTAEWAAMFADAPGRTVKHETVGDAEVSTCFMGINLHVWSTVPATFETMIFGGRYDRECARCSTWEEAEVQHAEMVALVKNGRE